VQMSHELRFGVLTLQHLPWEEEVKRWLKIESLGFDSVWLADHFVNYANPSEPWFESWTLLSALAAITTRIRIGTLVTSIPLRNPAVLARQALTVDHISNGRLELGLGAGASGISDPVYKMTGIEDWSAPERVARFREQVEIIDRLLRNKVSSYSGQFYRLEGTVMAPDTVQKPRPPITVAAMGKSMLKIAARYADSWNSVGDVFGAPPEVVVERTRKRCELLDRYCAEIGRDPRSILRSLLVFGSEAETAFASEDNFVEIVDRYTAIGINELIFYYPFFARDQIPTFERIARNIIPEIRKS